MHKLLRNDDAFNPRGAAHQPDAASASVRTVEELKNELSEDRQLATDTQTTMPNAAETEPPMPPVEDAKPSGFGFSFAPPPPMVEDGSDDNDSHQDAKPLFPIGGSEEDEPTKNDETGKHSLSPKKAERKFNIMFKVRDNLQSRLLAMWADDDDRDQFRMDEEDREILKDYYLQVIEDNGGKIPWYIDLLLVEGSVMLPKLQMAKKLKKVNAENSRLRAELAELKGKSPVAQAIALSPKKERKNWKIDVNGYYEKDQYNNYIAKAERTEKALLSDIEQIAFFNSKSVVQKAFNLTDQEISKLYPDA